MAEAKKTVVARKKLTTSRREQMTGVINAYVTATKENVSEIEAIQEFIDNSFDADSTKIDITIDEKKLFFSCCVTDYEKQILNVCVNYYCGIESREFKFFVKASEFDNKLTQAVKFILNF